MPFGPTAVAVGTPLVFDVGVFLAVIGVVLTIVFTLAEAASARTDMELLLAIRRGRAVRHRVVPDAATPAGPADHRARAAVERVEHPDPVGGRRDAREAAAHRGSALAADQFADPVPQSLILTAIVIGFGVLAFSLVLAHRVHRSAGVRRHRRDWTGPAVMLLALPILLPLGTAIVLHLLPQRQPSAARGRVRRRAADPRVAAVDSRPRSVAMAFRCSRSARGRRRSASRWSPICSAR